MQKFWLIFQQFLALGFVSFGGPAAHIGYFRRRFVEQLKWLSDEEFAGMLSLSQLLPGPGSSQTGFAIGLHRGGLAGGVAAFLGFSLPSFVLMYWLATTSLWAQYPELFSAIVHGLKVFAVAVVADATLGMGAKFCDTRLRQALAVGTAVVMLTLPSLWGQMMVLLVAAVISMAFSGTLEKSAKDASASEQPNALVDVFRSKQTIWSMTIFTALFVLAPLLALCVSSVRWFSDFYTAGSLVFGGGHVVLPLLEQTVGDVVSDDRFLVGYAAAQGVPGPMFSLATFLGAEMGKMQNLAWLAATLATLGIFLPGFLLVLGFSAHWQSWLSRSQVASAAAGINAAVVGLLLSALYQPVFTSGVTSALDMAMVIVLFWALRSLRVPIVWLVLSVVGVMSLTVML